jgi:predicted oxidoreductase
MKKLMLGETVEAPEIGLGCMRLPKMEPAETEHLIRTSMELGVNFFDHADVYGRGEAEAVFSKAVGMNSGIREQIILQTKCAIRPGCCYDFSKEHILQSVEGSLKRLYRLCRYPAAAPPRCSNGT